MGDTLQGIAHYLTGDWPECLLTLVLLSSIILLSCQDLGVSLWQYHCLREQQWEAQGKAHMFCACLRILGEKTTVGSAKGEETRWWGPRFCHQSNCCAWSLGPNYPPGSSLRESPITSWVVIMGESVCVHGCLCVYMCVEARNGCWASLNIISPCFKMASQWTCIPDLVRQADHQPPKLSSLYFLTVGC